MSLSPSTNAPAEASSAASAPPVASSLVQRLLNDERDAPFLSLMLRTTLWGFPMATLLFLHFRWWLAVPYLAVSLLYLFPPYTLMLHCTSHRQLFRKEHGWMNGIIPWVIGPLYGHTPGTYVAHHMGMHHPENNLWEDGSTTLPYQRDSLWHFLRYFFHFLFLGLGELLLYLRKTRRHKLARRALVGELGFWAVALVLGWFNPAASVTVFVIPVLFARFGMMMGNWSQHAFIDAASPGNAYRNSITCINVGYNDRCFNDGYHIGHHLNARLHWTEMRRDFEQNRHRYRDERAVVFSGIDYFVIWALLMTRSYRVLARHFVDLEETPRSEEQIIQLLRERTRPVPQPAAQ